MYLSKSELIDSSYEFVGGDIRDLSLDQVQRLITVSQYVTDLCVNEIERRGELKFCAGSPVLPYQSDYMLQTVLNR